MSEPRMAGSDEFKEELNRATRNKQIREEIGNDSARLSERISGVDRDAYDFTGYSDKDINMAMQGGTFDDNDYARLTGANQVNDEPDPVTDPVIDDPVDTPVDPPAEPITSVATPAIGSVFGIGNQTSNVTGDNNQVVQNQDNSGYGGNSSWKDAWMKNYFA